VKARSALVYSVLRLLAFLVPFGIMMIFPMLREYYWLAAIFAALIGLSLSMLFLRRPLNDVTAGLAERRAQRERRTAAERDADVEDAVADTLRGTDASNVTNGSATTDAGNGLRGEGPEQQRRVPE
jgi:hypothetical protein